MKDYIQTLIENDIKEGNNKLILKEFSHGDWLVLYGNDPTSSHGGTNIGFINSVYYYHSVELTALAAKELGKINDYEKYNFLSKRIYKAILDNFFSENGELKLKTQISYVLCLYYKIYINKDILIRDFKKRIENDLYHLKTGFIGTPLLLKTLFNNGMDEYAFIILLNEDYPSWIYAINLVATKIWERWNILLENGTISDILMNSFNHYAYGYVCETIYSRIAGLRNISPRLEKSYN